MEKLTESDAYEVINIFISDKLTNSKNPIIYWAIPQIEDPGNDSIYYDEILSPSLSPSYSLVTKNWDTTQIHGVTFVDGKEYEYFFDRNRRYEKHDEWKRKYNGQFLHCVSYPKLLPGTNTIVINHQLTRPYVYCGTGLFHEYFYEKTDSGWIEK